MAHNIGQMFYEGDKPWHGLGKRVESLLTMNEALEAGGLDYTVSLKPLALVGETLSKVTQRMAVVRDDRQPGAPGRVLGVVHPQFKALQNLDGAVLFDELFAKGKALYHTGGHLKEGEVIWLQAKLPEGIELSKEDKLNTYLLFSNSHDGSYPIDIRLTTVRVVCNNTLNMAVHSKDKSSFFRLGHSGNLASVHRHAQAFLDVVMATQRKAQADMVRLAEARCTEESFVRFLNKLLPNPTKPATAATNATIARAHATRAASVKAAREQVFKAHTDGFADAFVVGRYMPAAPDTYWGALNSFTGWVDHLQRIQGDRFAHVMFGTGDELKTKAFALALSETAPKAN